MQDLSVCCIRISLMELSTWTRLVRLLWRLPCAGLCFHGTVLVAQELPDGRQASVFSGVSPLSGMEPACRNDFHMYNRSSDVRTYFFAQFVGQTFDILQSGWLGILCISVLGPVLEELLFRGAITKELLRRYSPAKAILFSGLILVSFI